MILDNPEFQQKLVENINQALAKSSGTKTVHNVLEATSEIENKKPSSDSTPAVGEEISSGQLLDQMVKSILDATEKEPSFDAIIQEVLEAFNKHQVQTAAIQCNIDTPSLPVINNPPLYTATDPPPLVPAIPNLQIQQFPIQSSPTTIPQATTRHLFNFPGTTAQPPRTPLILRSAVGATAANNSATGGPVMSAEDQPSILANSSFGQLIDPNFSISKLIVLNSNDSAQKQLTDNCVGNTTAENLINQLPTNSVTDATDDQVYFDTTTGQLTFPIFITNDGLLTNLPLLINNDVLNQQLQNNNVSSLEGPRLEIPLSEPVNANQFSSNSIVVSSAQKENVIEKSVTAEKLSKVSEIKHYNTVPPASSNDRLLHDKATPSSNRIVNTKAFRSLSTPRKRSSHVRTLTFSPRHPITFNSAVTPLSSRKGAINRLSGLLPKTIPEDNKDKTDENETKSEQAKSEAHEKAVIKTVEILPTIANATTEKLTEHTNNSTNDTDNVPPLFVNEESSNQTIINKNVQAVRQIKKSKKATLVSAQDDSTPKRKQYRKAAVRSCKRQISKSAKEAPEEKNEKENEKASDTHTELEKPSHKDLMEEWYRLRNSNVELDVRLREINASSQSQNKKVTTKKRVRRKKSAAIKKKEKELAKRAEELANSKELEQELQNETLNDIQVHEEFVDDAHVNSHNAVNTKQLEDGIQHRAEDGTTESVVNKKDKTTSENSPKNQELEKQTARNIEKTEKVGAIRTESVESNINEVLEREKRNANMAFLLETPFKDPNFSSCNPPTPGIFAPSLETPGNKFKNPHNEMQASASFLFGSLTKSDMDTPLMSAITPGFRFTPFGIKDMGTPKSVPGTDYSSGGGSYYKPDESEDLDRNIDKMLRNSVQEKTGEANAVGDVDQEEEGEIIEDRQENASSRVNEKDDSKIEIEIPIEKLKVEPIVLKRVKSFGSEAVDCTETVTIDPHYTLASGLPEISAAEEECSSSSSSSSSRSSTSSSKSSSSSSSTSSSSSSSSSSSNPSVKSKASLEAVSKPKKGNDLDNLSEISSTEDEEWQKLTITDNDENSQLINNDGEVRYPVRSWLTPVKEDITVASKTHVQTEFAHMQTSVKTATIKVTLPLKSAEKRNRQVHELELKKERIKEKLKIDACTTTKKDKFTTTITPPPNISAALATSRMMHSMRDKRKKSSTQSLTHPEETTVKEMPQAVKEKRSLDVLTALNLSAKKQLPTTPESPQKPSRLLPTDINSQKKSFDCLPNKTNGKPKINITSITPNKTPQRKCLPIEARPVTRTIRKTGKKIVRTPLAFKVIHSPGKINSHSTTTTLAEFAASKTVNKSKETAAPAIQQTLRVSPRLLKPSTSRVQKSHESSAAKSKIVTRSSKNPTAKSKAAKSYNSKKKTETTKLLLEKEMKDILEDWKEESSKKSNYDEEFENDSEPAIPCKPKINLKARNAMVSTKQKKKVESPAALKTEAKRTEKKTLTKESKPIQKSILEEVPKVKEVTQKILNTDINAKNVESPATAAAAAAKEFVNCVDSEDDPLEDCQMQIIDETDPIRFIKCIYNGPECPPAHEPIKHDFSNFHMVVAIDEYEKHVWHISEGVCLFSSPPVSANPVAILPKKRKIRTMSIINENATATEPVNAVKCSNTENPAATSTPVIKKTSNSRLLAENTITKSSSGEEIR